MANKLFLSFWKLSLENLPSGRFDHKILDAAEARQMIQQAKQEDALVCVSSDDLLAFHNQRILEEQRELCQVLQNHFGVPVTLRDFFGGGSAESEEMMSVIPLEVAQVGEDADLIIVTCHYSLPEIRQPGELNFQVIPDSIQFHLITNS